jgi:hypothetical protein
VAKKYGEVRQDVPLGTIERVVDHLAMVMELSVP